MPSPSWRNHQLELSRLLDREITRPGTTQDTIDVHSHALEHPVRQAAEGRRAAVQDVRVDHRALDGIVNENAEPTPTWLFTQIMPPCNSTNFRHKVRPSPVPSCLALLTPT